MEEELELGAAEPMVNWSVSLWVPGPLSQRQYQMEEARKNRGRCLWSYTGLAPWLPGSGAFFTLHHVMF